MACNYGYIYKTTCSVNGKTYIGQSTRKGKRGESYLGSGVFLKKAIGKYGKDNFVKEILEWCNSKEQLNERERFFIAELKPDYNIAEGGEGGSIVARLPNKEEIYLKQKEGRKKNFKSRKGTYKVERSKEFLDKLKRPRPAQSKAMIGRKKSEQHRLNMKQAWKLRPILICPHCKKESRSTGGMKRSHFDNCKFNRDVL